MRLVDPLCDKFGEPFQKANRDASLSTSQAELGDHGRFNETLQLLADSRSYVSNLLWARVLNDQDQDAVGALVQIDCCGGGLLSLSLKCLSALRLRREAGRHVVSICSSCHIRVTIMRLV